MSERDPRLDPKPGDRISLSLLHLLGVLHVPYVIQAADNGIVQSKCMWPLAGSSNALIEPLDCFRYWARNATVLHRAEETSTEDAQ